MFNFLAKKAEIQKRAKMHVQFQNSCKKGGKCIFIMKFKKSKNEKKKAHTIFWNVFAFNPLCLFLHFQPQNSCKKGKNTKKCFKFQKYIIMQKKGRKYYFKKIMEKKAEIQKRMTKAIWGVFLKFVFTLKSSYFRIF